MRRACAPYLSPAPTPPTHRAHLFNLTPLCPHAAFSPRTHTSPSTSQPEHHPSFEGLFSGGRWVDDQRLKLKVRAGGGVGGGGVGGGWGGGGGVGSGGVGRVIDHRHRRDGNCFPGASRGSFSSFSCVLM